LITDDAVRQSKKKKRRVDIDPPLYCFLNYRDPIRTGDLLRLQLRTSTID